MAQAPDEQLSPLQKFSKVSKELNYQQQACFFLNAYWSELGEPEAENFWKFVQKFSEFDKGKQENGNSLDPFESARFLEAFGQAMTATERVAALKEIDIDTDKRMSLMEYAIWRYKNVKGVDIPTLMSRPQGTNEELKKAETALRQAQEEIQRIEKKKNDLEKASQGEGVKARSAANELAQLLAADQTTLNQFLITAEANLRKAQKSKDLSAAGSIWWLNREVDEVKKYKPKKNIKSDFVKS